MIIRIKALDTLFFRDGRPFFSGEDNVASGIFPPLPSVAYGALRSAYFSGDLESLKLANCPGDPTGSLRIKGLYLQVGEDICFPLPADCIKLKEEKDNKALLLQMRKAPGASSCPAPMVLAPPGEEEVKAVEDGLLDHNTINEYLNLRTKEFYYRQLTDYILPEPKTGIGRNRKTGTAEDHMLYRVNMRRLEARMQKGIESMEVSILVEFSGVDLPDKGLLKLGGEGKAVYYEALTKDEAEDLSFAAPAFKAKRFKLYFVTPTVFAGGWLPLWLDKDTLTGEYRGIKLKLLAGAVGKYIHVGGFDMNKGWPKTMRRAVPAGSVYYLEIISGDMAEVIKAFHRVNLSDYDSYAAQGFGLTLVGGIDND